MNIFSICGDNLVVNAIVGSLIGHGPLHVLWCYPLRDAGYDLVHTVRSGMLVVKKNENWGKVAFLEFQENRLWVCEEAKRTCCTENLC